MRGLYAAMAAAGLAGCATAEKTQGLGHGADGGIHLLDGGPGSGQHDAPVDSGPPPPDGSLMLTLSETPGGVMVYGDSIACANTTDFTTRDNIWYRAYQLSDFPMVTGAFMITSVNIAVQESAASPTINIKIGSYSGNLNGSTINSAQISSLAMQTKSVPPTTGTTGETLNVPIAATIPAGGKFVVEVLAPDQNTTGYFYIGATDVAETHPGYLSSASCSGLSTPVTTASLNAAGRIIINVNGMY